MKWTKKQLEILYDCWNKFETNKERIALIKKEFPQIPPLILLNKMRSMAQNDSKWIGMEIKRKNKKIKEKEKIEIEKQNKKDERQRRKLEKEKIKKIKEQKRIEKEFKNKNKRIKDEIKKKLKYSNLKEIENIINNEIFFCNKLQQFINNISCVFRIYSIDHNASKACEKCDKMDKYITILKEILDGKQKRIK